MKLYLSSFRLGNNPQRLADLFGNNKNIAVIGNAIDYKLQDEREKSISQEILCLRDLGLNPEEFDLRNYFNDNSKLDYNFTKFGGVWIRGGNVFILRRAMYQSGFDKLISKYSSLKDIWEILRLIMNLQKEQVLIS